MRLALLILPLLWGLSVINGIEAAGEERAKAPIISVEPLATPTTLPEKGRYDAGPSLPIPLGGNTSKSQDSGLPEPINNACFKLPNVPLFCVPRTDPQWGAEALAVGLCESGFRPEAVGAAGELGSLQVHPIHFPAMLKTGLNPDYEPDRFIWGHRMWQRSGWFPWSCGHLAEGAVVAKGE